MFKLPVMVPLLLLGLAAGSSGVARAEDTPVPKQVVIVANDTLKFSVIRIDAQPGQTVHVQLRNEGTMPKSNMGHDWVLLASDEDADTYAMAAVSSHDAGFQPKSQAEHVLASIPLLGPKEQGEVTFCAPLKPGKYPFICSCSGHSMAGMKGYLIVK